MNRRVDSDNSEEMGGGLRMHFSSNNKGNSHLQFEACRILIGLLVDYLSMALRTYRVGAQLNFHYERSKRASRP